MRFISYGLLLILSACLSACNQNLESEAFLPSSTGELAELVVIYHKSGSSDVFKEKVADVFGKSIQGLPNKEGRFKVLFTDESFFKGYFKEHHNIFVLLTEDNLEKLLFTVGEENRDRVLEIISNEEALGFNKKNLWANNQNVSFITAKDESSLLNKLQNRVDEVITQANTNELKTGTKKVLTVSTSRDSLYQNMVNAGFAIRKPSSYRVALHNDEYLWLRKESRKYEYGVMVYQTEYKSREQFNLESIISMRGSMTKQYIPGPDPGSYMIVDTRFDFTQPYYEEFNFKGHYGVKVKGWWRLTGTNNRMAGPFVLYSIYDEKKQRIITAEGFIYGPNEKKAQPLREIEIIPQFMVIK